jgi:hypothetical protein
MRSVRAYIVPWKRNKFVSVALVTQHAKRLRWSRGSVMAFDTQVRGFAPVGFLG